MDINTTLFTLAYEEWQSAENGAKRYIVRKHAAVLGVAPNTLYRRFREIGFMPEQRKEKATKGQSKIEGLHDMANTIAHLYAFIPVRANRKPPLELAIRKGIENGMLPERAREIHVSTFARVLREKGLLNREGRVLRFEAKFPMEQLQYDVSGSEYLYVHRFDNGEPVLRVRSSKSYKNKDRFENFRVWYHGYVDDCSRYWMAMPFVSSGENSADAIRFSKWAFALKEDSRIIFHGLPERIYMDNGPLAKAEATRNFFERQLGVEIKTHEPESSADTGKIEVRWRHLWSGFEAVEFLMDPHWEKREYTLTDIRERLNNYIVESNAKKHPNRAEAKIDVWRTGVMARGGVVGIAESAFENACSRPKRKVGTDGLITLDNVRYFVKGLLDTWVWVYRGVLDAGKIIVEDCMTHKRYEVKPFVMPGLDEIRTDKKLVADRIREEADEIRKGMQPGAFRGVYQKNFGSSSSNGLSGLNDLNDLNGLNGSIPMPVKVKDEKKVDDVFDIDVYPNISEAMKAFTEIAGCLDKEFFEDITALIIENKLNKQYVTDLAFEVHDARREGAG